MAIDWEFLGLIVLAGAVGAAWGLSEIVLKFQNETGLAIKTAGAWLLLAVNFLAAAGLFVLSAYVAPATRTLAGALALGLAWPTVFRNLSLKLGQPLDDADARNAAVLRVEETYAGAQRLALGLINGRLTRQRASLFGQIAKADAQALETYLRQLIAVSPRQDESAALTEYVDKLMARPDPPEVKRAYLFGTILDRFGREAINDIIRRSNRRT